MGKIIHVFSDMEELSLFFARKFADSIRETPDEQYFSLALSGGSTPRKVFEYMALHFREKLDWRKVLIFWSDERCVPPGSDESNYKMAKESLLDHISIPSGNIFRIQGEADPVVESSRYAEVIRRHVGAHHNIPRFDFLMLGLGDDGHTVSLFPDNLQLFGSDKLCEVSEQPVSKQKRITLTGQIINQAANVVFVVCGASKADMVARVIEKKEGWELLPASLVSPGEGELLWLLDKGAAGRLKPEE